MMSSSPHAENSSSASSRPSSSRPDAVGPEAPNDGSSFDSRQHPLGCPLPDAQAREGELDLGSEDLDLLFVFLLQPPDLEVPPTAASESTTQPPYGPASAPGLLAAFASTPTPPAPPTLAPVFPPRPSAPEELSSDPKQISETSSSEQLLYLEDDSLSPAIYVSNSSAPDKSSLEGPPPEALPPEGPPSEGSPPEGLPPKRPQVNLSLQEECGGITLEDPPPEELPPKGPLCDSPSPDDFPRPTPRSDPPDGPPSDDPFPDAPPSVSSEKSPLDGSPYKARSSENAPPDISLCDELESYVPSSDVPPVDFASPHFPRPTPRSDLPDGPPFDDSFSDAPPSVGSEKSPLEGSPYKVPSSEDAPPDISLCDELESYVPSSDVPPVDFASPEESEEPFEEPPYEEPPSEGPPSEGPPSELPPSEGPPSEGLPSQGPPPKESRPESPPGRPLSEQSPSQAKPPGPKRRRSVARVFRKADDHTVTTRDVPRHPSEGEACLRRVDDYDDERYDPLVPGAWSTLLLTLLAGGIAGAAGKITSQALSAAQRRPSFSEQMHLHAQRMRATMDKAVHRMVHKKGLRSLLLAHEHSMVRVVPYGAFLFGSHEMWKKFLRVSPRSARPKRMCAGALAGVTAVSITYPLDLLRVRVDAHVNEDYRSVRNGIRSLWAEGFRGMYRGYLPSVIGIIPYCGVKFFTYDNLKYRYFQNTGERPGMLAYCCYGTFAGILGRTVAFPMDAIRKRMQVTFPGDQKFDTIAGTFRNIYREEGMRGYFRHKGAHWFAAPLAIGISFGMFETVMDIFVGTYLYRHF